MVTCGNYNDEFICNILVEINKKIALIGDKDYKNSIYNLGLCQSLENYKKLIRIKNILEKIQKCNSCYAGINIEDIVSVAKNLING